ncbi:hypothetical protein BLNAU_15944 [Blattamonas nauphoetae]|uniref:Uncharacterized protein n=1 Tax=Blattamonas nauphoetae TaxID=2049346 RepID=A0ABQ9X955_9EUKA|nr:hypothetical protein BLNAU_15944 [Blattamonas nauphoetae]
MSTSEERKERQRKRNEKIKASLESRAEFLQADSTKTFDEVKEEFRDKDHLKLKQAQPTAPKMYKQKSKLPLIFQILILTVSIVGFILILRQEEKDRNVLLIVLCTVLILLSIFGIAATCVWMSMKEEAVIHRSKKD